MNTDGMFYFGCWDKPGHYLHRPGGRQTYGRDLPPDFPVRPNILDTGLLGHEYVSQVEGRAVLSHVGGWTILSFWDRSVDTRGGCNSSILIRGTWDFDTVVANFKAIFPTVWGRFKFPVVLASAPLGYFSPAPLLPQEAP